MQDQFPLNRDKHSAKRPNRAKFISVITGAGLFAALTVAGLSGVASAQTVIEDDAPNVAAGQSVAFQGDDDTGSDEPADEYEFSDEDQAVFDRYDQCLTDAGLDLGLSDEDVAGADVEPSETELDEDAWDAAFEQCDPILEDLSPGFGDLDLSPEDEAVFERFDQCLTNAGIDIEADGSGEAELDEATFDAAIEQCEPVLDDLSSDFGDADGFDGFLDLSPEDEAIFDQYDTCLHDNGIDALFDGEQPDEAAIDALFEQCDPLLDGLSAEAQEILGDCPDDDEHSDDADLEGAAA